MTILRHHRTRRAATTAAKVGSTTASVGVLAGKDVAEAFSDYVGALQVKVFQAQMTFQVHMGQIQQAIQFNDLNKYRAAAEDLESSLRQIRDGLPGTNAPDNLADADMPPFVNVQNAASDIISQYLEMAVDVGVNAHTGLNSSDDMVHDAKEVPKYEAKFRSVVLHSYKQFGVKRSAIDTDTLTLNASTH